MGNFSISVIYLINLSIYWLYISIVFLISFIPGLAFAGCFKNLSFLEKLSISFGFSFIIITLLVPFFAFKLHLLAQLIFAGIIIISIWYLLKIKSEFRFDRDVKFIALVFVFGLISKFLLQIQWEYPVMGGDWFWHTFSLPYIFEQGNWMPPRDRTQLFSILIYSIQKLLGTSFYQYWVSQIISVVINSVYLFPAYLIAKKAFGERVARISALFMLVTPFLIFNTVYTWPKNAAMYGVLMMIYFLFFSELNMKLRYSLAGFFGGLGFWFHNYAIFYIGIAILLLIYKEKMYVKHISKNVFNDIRLKKLFCFLLVSLIVIAPYFVWVYSYYGTFFTSKFVYYPFAVKGYESALRGDKQELLDSFYSTPVKEIIMIRVSNAIVTLTPAALPINPVATSFHTYNPIYYYSHDYPGSLSTLMYLVVMVWFIKYILGKTKTDTVIVSFIVFPFLINLFLWGWLEWGLVNQILHPTIPLLILLGINELLKVNNKIKNILVYVVFIGSFAENLIYAVLIGKFYQVEGGLNGVNLMAEQYIPGFQISDFVSAHFLLNDVGFFGNIIVSLITL